MSRIEQTVQTTKTAFEMKKLINQDMLSRPDVLVMLEQHHWDGNVLHASGKLGRGTIDLLDNLATISIELSALGSAAKGTIQDRLLKQINKLGL